MNAQLREGWEIRASACSDRWNLSNLQWVSNAGTARVAFCDGPDGPAFLKVSLEPGMVALEARTLSHFGPEISPAVYAVAEDLEALLMERIDVKHDLSALYPDAEREVSIWLPFFRRIEANPSIPDGFPTLAKYAEVFDRVLAKPQRADIVRLMEIGRNKQSILMGSPGENRLLHGDMHHFNLLLSPARGWVLIDPHGVVGHPYYELGSFLRNPWGACDKEPGVKARLAERVAILSDRLGVPAARVAEYGFYGAAFSIAWSLDEDDHLEEGMVVMAEACLNLS